METIIRKKGEPAPFYEVKQRYCSHVDANVILSRQIGTDGAYTCMSSHLCSENCTNKQEGAK